MSNGRIYAAGFGYLSLLGPGLAFMELRNGQHVCYPYSGKTKKDV